ncbi:DUF4878 domain-containing protein [Peribacillus asahii]|nr:DUF4878 domain-containing protein [Peribacillus asahii]USK61673.1 DUF4878 domain-containing protein [Peribacillus asahii]
MKKLSKKLLSGIMVAGLTVSMLAGCGSPKPTDTVNDFMTSIQEGDFEKASTFVDTKATEDFDFKNLNEGKAEGMDVDKLFKSLSKTYKFEKPVEVSKEEDTAKVKVEVTSVDFAVAVTSTISEVMPMAFGMAFSEDTEEADKAMDKMMETTLIKHLTAKDASMATREVTLNLKKDKEGEYKIVSDENLMEAVMANAGTIDEMFGEE